MTGLWQVSGRSDLTWDEAIRLDLYYVDNWSMLQDLSILTQDRAGRVSQPRRLLTRPLSRGPWAGRHAERGDGSTLSMTSCAAGASAVQPLATRASSIWA